MSSKQGPRLRAGMRTTANAGRIADNSGRFSYATGKEAM